MELLYCTCGHREGMHSARDGACFEHGCPCTHFVQRDYIPCPVCGDAATLSPDGFTCTHCGTDETLPEFVETIVEKIEEHASAIVALVELRRKVGA